MELFLHPVHQTEEVIFQPFQMILSCDQPPHPKSHFSIFCILNAIVLKSALIHFFHPKRSILVLIRPSGRTGEHCGWTEQCLSLKDIPGYHFPHFQHHFSTTLEDTIFYLSPHPTAQLHFLVFLWLLAIHCSTVVLLCPNDSHNDC